MSTATMERTWIPPVGASDGRYLAAARWQMFESVAKELVNDLHTERWTRAADVHERYAVADAAKGDRAGAKYNHEVAAACRERAELIRRYPADFTDTAEVLALILNEGVLADGARAA